MTVTRLDRLFRSVQNLIIVGIELRGRGIRIQAVEQNVDSNTLEGSDLMPPWQIGQDVPSASFAKARQPNNDH
ncbi:hypothetical protein [Streptomyces sp. NPDC004685]